MQVYETAFAGLSDQALLEENTSSLIKECIADAVLSDPSVKVYHMGTTLKKLGEGHESYDKAGHSLVTNGGRVLMALASAPDLKSAHGKALEAVSKVDCDNLFHRTDIGHWALGI